ncbi:MAG: fibronectin type III domain-containing protein, partial [Stenotrophomonas maltophilia]|nr:fibronectin type III domain-containing protein [Stenotrophomonas maltophilia]
MRTLALGLLLAVPSLCFAAAEANTQVPAGSRHYAATTVPDRIVASPAGDPGHGFAVAWRTDGSMQAPLLEIALAGDSPAIEGIRQVRATTRALQTENGLSHHHRADVSGLRPDTLYVYRVQGNGSWSAWNQLRTLAAPDQPLTLLYFGDTQNKNVSHVSRVVRAAQKA